MIRHQIIPADEGDAAALAQVIADAFHDLPPARWLIPGDDARRDVFPRLFGIFTEHALANGTVYTTPGRTAVALWLPVGEDGPAPPAGYDERLAAVTGAWAHRFRAFDAALDHRHPAGASHHHLAMLAVRPGHQGQGTGSALLRAHHATLDQQHIPAYLEASDPRNRALYQRYGYTDRPGDPFHLPAGGPPMWGMWRNPIR